MKTFLSFDAIIKTFFQNDKKRNFILFAVLVVSVILLYLTVFDNPFVWDDWYIIVKNKDVHRGAFLNFFSENSYYGSGSIGTNWRPLILSVFSTLWHFFGSWTLPYHAVSIFLHAVDSVLVFILFKKLFKEHYWPAFLSALLFAIHPLQTQAVVYAAGLGDPLGAFFIFSGAIAYLKAEENILKRKVFLWISFICLFLAFCSKENAVMMIGLLFVSDLFFIKTNEPLREKLKRLFKKIFPFFFVFVFYIITRVTFLNFIPGVFTLWWSVPFTQHLLVFFSTVSDYFRLLFVPLHLHMEHSVQPVHSLFELKTFFGFGIFVFLLFAIFSLWKKRPAVSFGVAWFLIAYSPNANLLMPTTELFGEHWLYISLPGIFFALFCFGKEVFCGKSFFLIGIFFLSVWIGWISFLTVNRNFDWETAESILVQTHKEEPKKVRAMLVLGSLYRDNGEYEKALQLYNEAIVLEPNNYIAYSERSDLYKKQGNYSAMVADWKRTCQMDIVYSPSYEPLLAYYQKNKEFDRAEELLNARLFAVKDIKDKLYTSIRLVSLSIAKKDHALAKRYLLMSDRYEKEYQDGWYSEFQRWLIQ